MVYPDYLSFLRSQALQGAAPTRANVYSWDVVAIPLDFRKRPNLDLEFHPNLTFHRKMDEPFSGN